MTSAILELHGIGKTYPNGIVANDGIDLTLLPGEIHAIIGENGAGKSTLMKILYGLEQPDRGDLRIAGRSVRFTSPRDAIAVGIGMVAQHFTLVPQFKVYENVILGAEPCRHGLLDRQRARSEVADLAGRFGLTLDVDAVTATVPIGQQHIEILKALYRDARILILDEPTAVLAPPEIEDLLTAIRALAEGGRSILFIAHKLPEVLAVADRITIMRSGRIVGRVTSAEATEAGLASLMIGRETAPSSRAYRPEPGKVICSTRQLVVTAAGGRPAVDRVDLDLRAGEITGLAGVEGNGQAELLAAIAGLLPIGEGSLLLGDTDLTSASIAQRREAGIAHIPEDRIETGLALEATAAENLIATGLDDRRFVLRGLLRGQAIFHHAETLIVAGGIVGAGADRPVSGLSGGNLQKLVIARELDGMPRVILVSHPTRGVDFQASALIWQRLQAARDQGAAILLVSPDIGELLTLADRILVFYRGRIAAAFDDPAGLDAGDLGRAMLGRA
jgi:simple sugar transport system ATP-binding protein